MSKIGIYIYGIMNSNSGRLFGTWGMNEFENVYTISYKDISAVVSESKIVADYTHLLKDALALVLVKHQEIIERIMSMQYEVIPVRLGTFAVNRDEVLHILDNGYPIIRDIFNKIKDKIEVDVAVTWSDFNLILKEIGEEKEIKEFKEMLLTKPNRITVEDQMKVGTMVKKLLDEKREKFAFQIKDDLKSVSEGFKLHELMDDRMVFNSAFLIDKNKQEDFDKKVEELNTEFAEKLDFRCIGPLPSYSFYMLEIKKIQFEEIDYARRELGLNAHTITKDKIKKAYYKASFFSHPDKNLDTPGIEKKFEDLTKAYKILVDYCIAAQQASQCDRFSFNEEEFKKNAILVKVRE